MQGRIHEIRVETTDPPAVYTQWEDARGLVHGLVEGVTHLAAVEKYAAATVEASERQARKIRLVLDFSLHTTAEPEARKFMVEHFFGEKTVIERMAVFGCSKELRFAMQMYQRVAKNELEIFDDEAEAVAWLLEGRSSE